MSVTTELMGEMRLRLPVRTFPAGIMMFPEATALTTSSAET